jgi:hypothetical protein
MAALKCHRFFPEVRSPEFELSIFFFNYEIREIHEKFILNKAFNVLTTFLYEA